MPERNVPFSVNGIKSLIKDLNLLAKELNDDIKVDAERAMGRAVASDVRLNIATIQDPDGNYLGYDNPGLSVSVEAGLHGHDVVWNGQQIAYLEFGTGAPGAAGAYPGSAMAEANYHPDPSKDAWWYMDAKIGPWMSLGLPPQAPMYRAALDARTSGRLKAPAAAVLNKAVRRHAVSV